MMKVVGCIIDGHNLWLVGLAGLVCVLASHSAFSLFGRTTQEGPQRQFWLLASAVCMGFGVWATHFVAMLAYRTPWPVGYDVPYTALSALIAVAMSWAGLWLARHGWAVTGGAVAGAAITSMHFTGMAALEGAFLITWDASYIHAAIIMGIGLSMLAFKLLSRADSARGRLGVVLVFVLAICSLHFTAMSAATLSFDPLLAANWQPGMDPLALAVAVAAVAALLLGAGLLSAVVDSYLTDRNAREADRLRRYVAELEETQSELRATTDDLTLALEAAAASSQAKSQFLAAMSHELRTPLNAILGFAELMRGEHFGPLGHESYAEYLDDIHRSGNHLLNLINDILDFSKIESGQFELREETTDAGSVIDECIRLIGPQAQSAGITLHTHLPDSPIYLFADQRRLRQIALNLLSNAVKFTPKGGSVDVTVGLADGGVELCVRDTGVGMKPEQIPIALEVFGQVDGRLSRKYEGTGLGLPLSRRLAELHGGSLTLESTPGEGTTVTIRFPADRLQPSLAA